ncbi:MAG TPA: hypothetical protein VNC78_11315 [Actinomycetota bacterium]|nr:hypothetical protein [Actinomycetota bacterium]
MRARHDVPRGISPAPSPTQPIATIWNGTHGPSPPTKKADAAVPSAPSENPNAGPNEFPASRTTMNIAENPPTNPGRRNATIAAARVPSNAIAFGPMPPRSIWTNSTVPKSPASRSAIQGASAR